MVAAGVRAGTTEADLPREYYEGVVAIPECVDEEMAQDNLGRAIRRLVATKGK